MIVNRNYHRRKEWWW